MGPTPPGSPDASRMGRALPIPIPRPTNPQARFINIRYDDRDFIEGSRQQLNARSEQMDGDVRTEPTGIGQSRTWIESPLGWQSSQRGSRNSRRLSSSWPPHLADDIEDSQEPEMGLEDTSPTSTVFPTGNDELHNFLSSPTEGSYEHDHYDHEPISPLDIADFGSQGEHAPLDSEEVGSSDSEQQVFRLLEECAADATISLETSCRAILKKAEEDRSEQQRRAPNGYDGDDEDSEEEAYVI